MATYAEKISAYEARRASNVAAMNELQKKFDEKGETLDADADEEFNTLNDEIGAIDKQLDRYRVLEKANLASVKPVKADTEREATASRAGATVQVRRELPKGMLFTRMAAARICSRLDNMPVGEVAKSMFPDTPEVEVIAKAAVASGNTTDTTWAAPLVQLNNATNEFLDLLRPATIIGRIPGLSNIPFNTKIPRATLDPTAYWVGQGQIKPISAGGFDSIELTFAKAAGIVVMTEELVRFSKPGADTLMQNALIKAVTYVTDRTFVDPTASATGSSPASITNGVTPVTATGTTADAFRDDLGSILSAYADADMPIEDLILIMRPGQALKLSLMRNTLGGKEFADLNMGGGVVEGVPVITSNNIPATAGSPADGYPIIAVAASQILIADDGAVSIDMSREASLVMDSTPDSPLTASTVTRNLWQHNELAIKAERYISWKAARTGAVQMIAGAKYA